MEILTVIPHAASIDGLHRAALDFARGLAARGHSLHVVTKQGGDSLEDWAEVAAGVLVVPGLALSPRRPGASARAVGQLLRAYRGARFDVVHCHRIDLLPAAAMLGRRFGAAVLFHAHNAPPPWARLPAAKPRSAGRISSLVVASEFMVGEWRRAGARAESLAHLPYGIDVERFGVPAEVAAAKRAELGFGPDEFVIAYVGRLERTKGVHTLVDAFARLAHGDPALRLVVKGSASADLPRGEAAAYRAELQRLAGASPVTWLPQTPDVAELYAAVDLVVMPSLWQEPSGLVVPEGFASRVPVLASAVGGIPEQLPELDVDLLFPPGDVDALAARIGDLRGWRSRRPDLGEALRAHVVRTRSLDVAAGSLDALVRAQARDRSIPVSLRPPASAVAA